MKSIIGIILISTLGFAKFNDFYQAPGEPKQGKVKQIVKKHNGGKLKFLHSYSLDARVLSAKKYSWDESASIMTHDFGLAWGRMSETQIFNQFEWDQHKRFLIYAARESVVRKNGGKDYVNSHIANVHLIPKDWTIESKLNRVKRYDMITLKGYLVDVYKGNKVSYTSVSRNDNGAGACEIMFVTDIQIKKTRTKNPFYYQKQDPNKRLSKRYKDKLDYSTPGKDTRGYQLRGN